MLPMLYNITIHGFIKYFSECSFFHLYTHTHTHIQVISLLSLHSSCLLLSHDVAIRHYLRKTLLHNRNDRAVQVIIMIYCVVKQLIQFTNLIICVSSWSVLQFYLVLFWFRRKDIRCLILLTKCGNGCDIHVYM